MSFLLTTTEKIVQQYIELKNDYEKTKSIYKMYLDNKEKYDGNIADFLKQKYIDAENKLLDFNKIRYLYFDKNVTKVEPVIDEAEHMEHIIDKKKSGESLTDEEAKLYSDFCVVYNFLFKYK